MTRLLWLILASIASTAAQAQSVSVRVSDSATGRPLVGALVSVRDPDGKVSARALTNERGTALLPVPPVAFRIRADAIGYAGRTGELIPPGPAAGPVVFALAAAPFALPEVTVTAADAVCRMDQEQGTAVARIWDEARKALTATTITRSLGAAAFEIELVERELTATGRIVTEQRSTKRGPADRPFRAADPAMLARDGYVQTRVDGVWYHGPDAELLLSEGFLADHCFSLARGSRDLVGLAFSPAPERTLADVKGTLWLSRATLELSHVDFTFTGVELPAAAQGVGGRVEFAKLPSGGWYVRDWRIRMPVITAIVGVATNRLRLDGYRETGGRSGPVGTVTVVSRTAVVGRIHDSLAAAPLAGAVVSLQAGAYADTTDADGRFEIAMPGVGDYLVTVRHSRLQALGIDSLVGAARIARGLADTVDLAVPSEVTILTQACAGLPGAGTRTVLGTVRDSTGAVRTGPIWVATTSYAVTGYSPSLRPGARRGPRVSVSERGTRWETETDPAGHFRLCGLPAAGALTIGIGPVPLLTLEATGRRLELVEVVVR